MNSKICNKKIFMTTKIKGPFSKILMKSDYYDVKFYKICCIPSHKKYIPVYPTSWLTIGEFSYHRGMKKNYKSYLHIRSDTKYEYIRR